MSYSPVQTARVYQNLLIGNNRVQRINYSGLTLNHKVPTNSQQTHIHRSELHNES